MLGIFFCNGEGSKGFVLPWDKEKAVEIEASWQAGNIVGLIIIRNVYMSVQRQELRDWSTPCALRALRA